MGKIRQWLFATNKHRKLKTQSGKLADAVDSTKKAKNQQNTNGALAKNRTTKQIGDEAEHQALKFLQSKGLKLIEKNFSCKMGEIDLIMRDKSDKTLVFVEVRFRKSNKFGDGLASVNAAKQHKIQNSANYYLLKKGMQPLRFDVISMTYNSEKTPEVENWIKNAF